MKALDKIFTEKQSEEIAQKILARVSDKIKNELTNSFIHETEEWLYEQYINTGDRIKKDLITQIAGGYVSSPANFDFQAIRDKIWAEHKDKILPSLTDEMITANISNIFKRYCDKNYCFNWQWKDDITAFILANWDSFKDDERIANGLGREIERLKYRIQSLENELKDALECSSL